MSSWSNVFLVISFLRLILLLLKFTKKILLKLKKNIQLEFLHLHHRPEGLRVPIGHLCLPLGLSDSGPVKSAAARSIRNYI